MMWTRNKIVALAATVIAAVPAIAQTGVVEPAYDATFTTHHVGIFGGRKIGYNATVAPTLLSDDQGRPTIRFVTTDYVADTPVGARSDPRRPVIFAFAGGPSGPSVAYHIRLLGPRQYLAPAPGQPASTAMHDNPDCLLDVADLVFVDPAETGFTRVQPAGKRATFYSVGGDATSIIALMDRWLAAHHRENAPRYVMGGSYGSVRALRIAWELRDKKPLAGLLMTADSLMIQQLVGVVGSVLPLPTMAEVAVYHGKVARAGRSDGEIADLAWRFAIEDYLPALAQVQDLSPDRRKAIAGKLQAIIGLPADEILAHNLEISTDVFRNSLLRGEARVLDNRFDGRDNSPADAAPKRDDGMNAAFLHYMAEELHVTYDMSKYSMIAPDTAGWDYSGPNGAPRNDWPTMLQAVLANPAVEMFSANGLYDLQGVMGQVRWLTGRTLLPRERMTIREYPGGHGLYMDPPTAHLILGDLRALLGRVTATTPH